MSFQARLESALMPLYGEGVSIVHSHATHGGSINDTRIIELNNNEKLFVKTHPRAKDYPGMFEMEFRALELLFSSKTIRVPKPLLYLDEFIVMESLQEGVKKADWAERLGRDLAELHLATRQTTFGFSSDNYLGTSKQPNKLCDSWLTFWRDQRFLYQVQMLGTHLTLDDPLFMMADQLLEKLECLIGHINEEGVLLHGDLWSGNAAADENGDPVIFDPASYYGHREAEFGMMRLFGGFGPRCEAAYAEVWPLAEGADERIALYRLYHELNHLNLFGRSYYDSCVSTIRSLL